jgi:hypothetical protein
MRQGDLLVTIFKFHIDLRSEEFIPQVIYFSFSLFREKRVLTVYLVILAKKVNTYVLNLIAFLW